MWIERERWLPLLTILLQAVPVRCCPSRLMHRWTRFIILAITWIWQVITAFLSSEILSLALCNSVEHVRNTSFQAASSKEITNERFGRKDRPRNVAISVVILGKVCSGEYTVDNRPHPCVHSMACLAGPIANLVSVLSPGLPEYYVNQNDEWNLPNSVVLLYCTV